MISKLIISITFFLYSPALFAEDTIKDEMEKIEVMVQISEMYGRDQGIRSSWYYLFTKGHAIDAVYNNPTLKARILEIDTQNVEALKTIIARWGWPGLDRFSPMTDQQAWIIAQHADHDPKFQEDVLRLLRDAAQKKATNPANFAFLYDRVNYNKGNEQVYGTQGACMGKSNWQPHPIQHPDKVDAYRKSVNLPSMEEYKKKMDANCISP